MKKNRAIVGLSAACMSALVATAVGCGEPTVEPYTPAQEDDTEEVATETEAEEAESEEAEADLEQEEAADPNAEVDEADAEAEEEVDAEEATEADAEEEGASEEAAQEDAEEVGAEADEAAAASDAVYADGTYTAEGKGIGGKFEVTVTVEDGVIAAVEVGDNSETQGIGSKAIEQLPELIVEANGIDGVDGVSGASVTSKAIFTAVTDCLEQASA
jgi:uncharacterized protein with FMN-binding domain